MRGCSNTPSGPGLTRPSSFFITIAWMAGSGAGHEGKEEGMGAGQ